MLKKERQLGGEPEGKPLQPEQGCQGEGRVGAEKGPAVRK